METTIFCTFRVDGLHQWKGTSSYLKHPHRHMFHFRVDMSVTHDDREVEFIALRRAVMEHAKTLLPDRAVELSCEMLAKDIIAWLNRYYPRRQYKVEVSEDGENGATVSCDCRSRG